VVALLALSVVPTRTFASEPTAADKASAKDYVHEGKELRGKGDHAGALKKFSAAYAIVPTPITGLAVAQEQVALEMLVEARDTLGEIQRMPTKATESPEAKTARDDAATLLAEIMPKIPIVEIKVSGAPAGSTVTLTVDGRTVPAIAASEGLRINPGHHTVVASVAGRADATKAVDLKTSERGKVELVFAASDAGPAKTDPSAEPTTTTEPTKSSPPDVDSGSSGSGSSRKTIGLILGGGGVVIAGIGGFLAFKGNDDFKHPGDDAGVCNATCQSNQSSAQTKTRLGFGLVGLGAAALATGVVLFVLAPGDNKSGSSKTQFALTPTGFVFKTAF